MRVVLTAYSGAFLLYVSYVLEMILRILKGMLKMKEFNFWCKENTDFGKCDNKKCGFLSAAVMVTVRNVFIILRIQLFVKIVPPLNL